MGARFQYETVPQKDKGVSQKNQNKNFVKKRITKYFGGFDPMNDLYIIKRNLVFLIEQM